MPVRRSFTPKGYPQVDNTFQSERFVNAASRFCQNFSRQESLHKQYNEFEESNLKRLVKKQDTDNYTPRYSVGNSKFTTRPPTGIDLALGLNGYDKLSSSTATTPARVPSSLKPLDDVDDMDKVRRRMGRRELEDVKWDRMRQEVEEMRKRENEERKAYVDEATKKKFEQESEAVREETTRQLNRAVVDDWNYQTNFKQKRQEEEKLAEMAAAYHEKQLIEEDERLEQVRQRSKQTNLYNEREAEKDDLDERKFRENVEKMNEHNANMVKFGRMETETKMTDERMKQETKQRKDETREFLLRTMETKEAKAEVERANNLMRERADIAENVEFNLAHEKQLNVERRNAADDETTFRRFNDAVDKKENAERRARDQYFAVEGRDVFRDDRDRSQRLAEDRKRMVLHHADLIQDQIRERAKVVLRETEVKRREEEARLEYESNYRSALLADKERKAQEQRSYRDYLFGQMEERKRLQLQERQRERIFLEDVRTDANKLETETKIRVSDVNVNQNKYLPKPAEPEHLEAVDLGTHQHE